MTRKNRFIILAIFAVLFFIVTPYLVLYSLGYRVDFAKMKIVATGGIYIKALPQELDITIDSKIKNKTGRFSSDIFQQNLLPGTHSVLIAKNGYYDYRKNLEVQERAVTKLEHVILFKKDIIFEAIPGESQLPPDQQVPEDAYVIKNNNLYYSNIPQNNTLSKTQKNTPVAKNIIIYKVSGGNIIWLGLDGFLYKSLANGTVAEKLNSVKISLSKTSVYSLFVFSQHIFLKEGAALWLLNKETKSLLNFYNPATQLELSPSGQKFIFYNDYEILYSLNADNLEKIFLNRFSEKISELQWINDDYIIFKLNGKLVISEVDSNQPNMIEIGQTVLVNGIPLDIKDSKMLFNQRDKKLYILKNNTLLVSEKLIP